MAKSCLLTQYSVLLAASCISPSGISDRHYAAPHVQLPPIQTAEMTESTTIFLEHFFMVATENFK